MQGAKNAEALNSPLLLQTLNNSRRSSRIGLSLILVSLLAAVPYLQRSVFGHADQMPRSSFRFSDPAKQFKDDIFPLRESEPWDISVNYPYPRVLEYDVNEGTWLRLDVHPKSGDVVFDMLGDLYCLPASSVDTVLKGGERVRARPVLLGVPHDADPHFSPDGKLLGVSIQSKLAPILCTNITHLVYKSDAGHGIENIWVKEWKGCEEADVRAAGADMEPDQALSSTYTDEELLARGAKETLERRHARLLREGRLGGDVLPGCSQREREREI
jgi:hypothetical protein